MIRQQRQGGGSAKFLYFLFFVVVLAVFQLLSIERGKHAQRSHFDALDDELSELHRSIRDLNVHNSHKHLVARHTDLVTAMHGHDHHPNDETNVLEHLRGRRRRSDVEKVGARNAVEKVKEKIAAGPDWRKLEFRGNVDPEILTDRLQNVREQVKDVSLHRLKASHEGKKVDTTKEVDTSRPTPSVTPMPNLRDMGDLYVRYGKNKSSKKKSKGSQKSDASKSQVSKKVEQLDAAFNKKEEAPRATPTPLPHTAAKLPLVPLEKSNFHVLPSSTPRAEGSPTIVTEPVVQVSTAHMGEAAPYSGAKPFCSLRNLTGLLYWDAHGTIKSRSSECEATLQSVGDSHHKMLTSREHATTADGMLWPWDDRIDAAGKRIQWVAMAGDSLMRHVYFGMLMQLPLERDEPASDVPSQDYFHDRLLVCSVSSKICRPYIFSCSLSHDHRDCQKVNVTNDILTFMASLQLSSNADNIAIITWHWVSYSRMFFKLLDAFQKLKPDMLIASWGQHSLHSKVTPERMRKRLSQMACMLGTERENPVPLIWHTVPSVYPEKLKKMKPKLAHVNNGDIAEVNRITTSLLEPLLRINRATIVDVYPMSVERKEHSTDGMHYDHTYDYAVALIDRLILSNYGSRERSPFRRPTVDQSIPATLDEACSSVH